MLDIQNYSFLIIFPDGTVYEGEKFHKVCNHYEILDEMKKKYPYFMQIADSYELKVHKEQLKLYNQLVKDGAIIYHAWSTYVLEKTNDVNVYLADSITIEQKKFMDSIADQLYMIENVIPHELCDERFLKMSKYDFFQGSKYIYEYIEEHLIKYK